MWRKNLLFGGLLAAVGLVFAGSLLPQRQSDRTADLGRNLSDDNQLRQIVGRLDASFAKTWTDQNLTPADPAPDLQVARRLSLALTGTIPSLEEIRRFEQLPPDDRLPRWVDHLLSDQRTHDYLAERLARNFVGAADGPFLIYRRRRFVTWLSEQLAQNRPYDALVRDLISSDGLWTNEPATNFITATIKPGNQGEGPEEAALAARVARACLGIRLDCAECHDHPFEPWKQRDFHGLAAFFARTEQTLTGIRDGNKSPAMFDRTTGESITAQPHVPFRPELLGTTGTMRDRLAEWVTHPKNSSFALAAANRMWALMLGRPLVTPVDNLRPSVAPPEPLALLAQDFVDHQFDLRRMIRVIAATRVFRLDSGAPYDLAGEPLPGREITAAHEEQWAVFPLTRLRSEQVVGGLLQASMLSTIDYDSHILIKLARTIGQTEFVKRYGDAGEDELEAHGGTIPQRLLMMNGNLVKERTAHNPLTSACSQIALLAPNDAKAVEAAYLATLSRRPAAEEMSHFQNRLRETQGAARQRMLEDMYWELLNSTEFSWNH